MDLRIKTFSDGSGDNMRRAALRAKERDKTVKKIQRVVRPYLTRKREQARDHRVISTQMQQQLPGLGHGFRGGPMSLVSKYAGEVPFIPSGNPATTAKEGGGRKGGKRKTKRRRKRYRVDTRKKRYKHSRYLRGRTRPRKRSRRIKRMRRRS